MRTHVDSARRRATAVPPPIAPSSRKILYEKLAISPLYVRGGPDIKWRRDGPIGCSRRGGRNMPCHGTPLLHHHGVVARRVPMRVLESCRKQTEEPR